jgi:23S rRNA (adenine2030-N6)-methyltransferase
MYGSGMFVINPPWILQQNAPEVLPWLAATLAQDNSAHYVLNQSEQL